MTFRQGGKWDELVNGSGEGCEVLCYPPEVVDSLVDSFTEVDSGLSLGRGSILEAPKHVTCSW